MGSFKQGDMKLNGLQIVEWLDNNMTTEQTTKLGQATKRMANIGISNSDKTVMVHGMIECYKDMGNTTDEKVMEVRKAMKTYITKYMNGGRSVDGEESMCRSFMNKIWG